LFNNGNIPNRPSLITLSQDIIISEISRPISGWHSEGQVYFSELTTHTFHGAQRDF